MTISEMLLPEFDQEMANTRKMLAVVPDDKIYWKPHEKSMTLGRLASHVAEMSYWAQPVIQQDSLEILPDQKPFNASSQAEILEYFDKNAAIARELISGASDETLARSWSFIFRGHPVFTMPKAAVLRNMVFNHMVHHRGQLSVYLRMHDIAIPGMYGPSADEKL